ncbi:nitroreductase [Ahrensia sp. R2A130]|uniref:nitroreductase family protein n=1 Tax=Ahrensia sp. R2A130 TaxID=744979 RepID=UPI0001E0F81E|nr:nitroreductase [Ahrensia sp. R2A130]EFL90454.1 nitroreductase [Ahrensia sp. R2A130]
MNDQLEHLRNRRSSLSMTLAEPGPDEAQLRDMMTIAARVPDHGKLAPWRFEVWTPAFRQRVHGELQTMLDSSDLPDVEKLRKGIEKLLHAPTVVAIISTATNHPKIPLWEQHLSAGAACMNMLHAANAHGFEAQWLTAWYVYDTRASAKLGLNNGEQIAAIVHIGSSDVAKQERDRPNLDDILTVREA